jgi:hypothetical protein
MRFTKKSFEFQQNHKLCAERGITWQDYYNIGSNWQMLLANESNCEIRGNSIYLRALIQSINICVNLNTESPIR